MSDAKSLEKFILLQDLGTIIVPEDYQHENQLDVFNCQYRNRFSCNPAITDSNFPNPSRVLKPGEILKVLVFSQIGINTTTSATRIKFLRTQNSLHTGAQGATLVFDQKRDQLQKGRTYVSFDEKVRLWKDSDGNLRLPTVYAFTHGGFSLRLGHYKRRWLGYNDAFFGFFEV